LVRGAAKRKCAPEQREHEKRDIDAVKADMHLLPRDKPDGERRRNGEAGAGERRMEGRQTAPSSARAFESIVEGRG
jgi:hypothetical protein